KLTTVYRMKRDANLLEAEKRIISTTSVKPPVISPTPRPPLALPRLTGIPARIESVLERKGQVILYGPPGTGKTYWAEQTARELSARSRFEAVFEHLTQEQQLQVFGDVNLPRGNVRLCSLHPAYAYEKCLEAFRSEPVNCQI